MRYLQDLNCTWNKLAKLRQLEWDLHKLHNTLVLLFSEVDMFRIFAAPSQMLLSCFPGWECEQKWEGGKRRIWGEGLITFDVRLRLADYCDGRAPPSPPPPPHFGPSLNFFSSINTGSNTERGNRANEPNLGLNLRGPAIWLNLTDWHSVFCLTNYLKAVCSSWFVNHVKRDSGYVTFYKFGFVQSEKQASKRL